MDKFIVALGSAIFVMAIVALAALLGGTLVYWLWPIAIPAAFPGLVKAGTLAASLTWWQSVALSWVMGLLIKSSQPNNNKKD